MSRSTHAVGFALVAPLSLVLAGCGASERDHQAYVESEGLSNVVLTKTGKVYSFTGTKGEDLCTGSVGISKGIGTTHSDFSIQCALDTRKCKPGAAVDCVRLADQLYAKEVKVFPVKAAELYRTACADKNGHACGRVSEFEAIGKKWDAVRDFAKQGCDLDDGDACSRLARTEALAQGTAKNEAKALELFKKGCDKGSMGGCRSAAGLLVDHEPPDNTGALPYAKKACAVKHEDSCIVLGLAQFNTKDYGSALPLLQSGCAATTWKTHGMSCNLAGAILFDGLGMPKDLVLGASYVEKACEADNSDGCANVGRMYKLGLGVKRDPAKSTDAYAKACKLGATKHCVK